MSWMQKLCEVYDAAERSEKVGNYAATPVLLRLYHGTQQAQIELTITEQGELVRGSAHAIADKDETEWKLADAPFTITDYPRFAWRAPLRQGNKGFRWSSYLCRR